MLDKLNQFQFVRKLIGGVWYKVGRFTGKFANNYQFVFIKTPLSTDLIINNEVYFNGNGQATFVFCPSCGIELIIGGEYMGDGVASNLVKYCCNRCQCISTWDFGPPAPILIEYKIKQVTGIID